MVFIKRKVIHNTFIFCNNLLLKFIKKYAIKIMIVNKSIIKVDCIKILSIISIIIVRKNFIKDLYFEYLKPKNVLKTIFISKKSRIVLNITGI